MARQETIDKVIKIAREQIGLAAEKVITEASSLSDDLGADSVDAIEIAFDIEMEFDITLPENLEYEARTIGDLVNAVEAELPRGQ